ncbi:MAG: exopolyphosphatase [Bacteroidia bacterium]|jgi:exopolyphosphatase/guanosine-5'-triphosphate,3'-diphosphate pyrophosphatase|nr:exopolyphosphatase [Bacteroidia bacterium]
MIFAAIDIGSNAMRLLFCRAYEVNGKPHFSKEELIRVPIRLGEDVFLNGRISEKKIEKLTTAMIAFQKLIAVYQVDAFRVVATSAMRDASNSKEVIEHIEKESGLKIEIIDGKLEAQLVFSNHIEEMLNPKHAYMYIDVGGGSTELTLYHNQKVIASKSFNIGTVRMLLNKVEKDEWDYMKDWIKKTTLGIHPIHAIGSGGNINKIYKMTKKENNNISYSKLKGIYEMLNSYTYNERVEVLSLKPDRADVIVHAAKIFITIMKTAEMETIFVPQIGLSDGIVHDLYEKQNK